MRVRSLQLLSLHPNTQTMKLFVLALTIASAAACTCSIECTGGFCVSPPDTEAENSDLCDLAVAFSDGICKSTQTFTI